MEELILKRAANITSADALDEINSVYPDAEILSFRRVKEAGNDSDFFVTRIRVAYIAEDGNDVVVEDEEHEKTEEDKMNRILDLLKEIKNDVDSISEEKNSAPGERDIEINDLDQENPLVSVLDKKEEDGLTPLPDPKQPPYGLSEQMGVVSSLIVSREANVLKSVARLELIREFSPQYKIASIEEKGGFYFATLKTSATERDEEARDILVPRAEVAETGTSNDEDGLETEMVGGEPAENRKRDDKDKDEPRKDMKGISPYAESRPDFSMRQKVPNEILKKIKKFVDEEEAYGKETNTDVSFKIRAFLDELGVRLEQDKTGKSVISLTPYQENPIWVDPEKGPSKQPSKSPAITGIRSIKPENMTAHIDELAKLRGFSRYKHGQNWMTRSLEAVGRGYKENGRGPIDWYRGARTPGNPAAALPRQRQDDLGSNVSPTQNNLEAEQEPMAGQEQLESDWNRWE